MSATPIEKLAFIQSPALFKESLDTGELAPVTQAISRVLDDLTTNASSPMLQKFEATSIRTRRDEIKEFVETMQNDLKQTAGIEINKTLFDGRLLITADERKMLRTFEQRNESDDAFEEIFKIAEAMQTDFNKIIDPDKTGKANENVAVIRQRINRIKVIAENKQN